MLLWHAEALNELQNTYEIPSWDGSEVYTIQRDTREMSENGVRPVRVRAGLPDFPASVYASPDEFREHLRHERMVEFFAENSRYYDIRRWKTAPEEMAEPIYGCDPMMDANHRDLFHQNTILYELPTVFNRKMYFWPISHNELRRNYRMTQNPGWTTFD